MLPWLAALQGCSSCTQPTATEPLLTSVTDLSLPPPPPHLPTPNSVIEPAAPLVPPTPSPVTPRHTDFLRRKMGHYASDNHGVAPTASPVVVKPGSKSTSSLGKAGKATAVPAPAHALAVVDSPKPRRRERNRATIVGDQAAAETRIPAPVADKPAAIEFSTKPAAIERERTF